MFQHRKLDLPSAALLISAILFLFCVARAAYFSHYSPASLQKPCQISEEAAPLDDHESMQVRVKGETASAGEAVKVLLTHPLCVVVSGVVPGDAEKTLMDNFAIARLVSQTQRDEYRKAASAWNDAVRASDEDRLRVIAAQRDNAGNLSELQAASTRSAASAATLKSSVAELAKASKDADDAYQAAAAALTKGTPPIEVTPFLDGHKAAHAAMKVSATAKPQALLFDFGTPTDANTPVATFWRDVLNGGTQFGSKTLRFGLARAGSDAPDATAKDPVDFQVYDLATSVLGAGTIVFLIASVVLFARDSTLLRDNNVLGSSARIDAARTTYNDALTRARDAASKTLVPATGAAVDAAAAADPAVRTAAASLANEKRRVGKPIGPYSLGRSQMALWLVMTTCGFGFLWLTLGQYLNVINASILVLLGLNSATGLLAVQIGSSSSSTAVSKGFVRDILNDGEGVQLQRIQVVVWSVVLAVIFVWNVIYGFSFVHFDDNLLLLMGIAQSAYLGFKVKEAQK